MMPRVDALQHVRSYLAVFHPCHTLRIFAKVLEREVDGIAVIFGPFDPEGAIAPRGGFEGRSSVRQ